MTFQVTGSPYNAPIPYGVTVHPFANITVVDTNTHPNIRADVFAGGAGHSSLQGTNLIGWKRYRSWHGVCYQQHRLDVQSGEPAPNHRGANDRRSPQHNLHIW